MPCWPLFLLCFVLLVVVVLVDNTVPVPAPDTSVLHEVIYVTSCVAGKRASEGERREAMRNAQVFIKAKGLKPGTAITRSLPLPPLLPVLPVPASE